MKMHTFELRAPLSYGDYRCCRDYFYENAKRLGIRCYEKCGTVIYTAMKEDGIILYLKKIQEGVLGGYLSVRVNPSKVLNHQEPTELFTIQTTELEQLVHELAIRLSELPLNLSIWQYALSRLDLCCDCLMDTDLQVLTYIHLLHKTGTPRTWSASTFQSESDMHSFRKANGRYQVTVYDKLHQLQQCGIDFCWDSSHSILRVEVALLPSGICHVADKYALDQTLWFQIMSDIADKSDELMRSILHKIIPNGDYYTLESARCLIDKSGYHENKKTALKEFLKKTGRYPEADMKTMKSWKNGKKRLSQLCELGINPVAIPVRAGLPYLRSLFSCILRTCSAEQPEDSG